MRSTRFWLFVLTVVMLCGSCAMQRRITSNSLDFLYPAGSPAVEPSDVELQLPVRVGVAFSPSSTHWQESFTETQKQALLEQVAAAFADRDGLASVQVIPSTFLKAGGGFDNLDRLVSAFGIDAIALVSYDQFQFSDSTRKSWAYWTLLGAYVVKGEKNETHTMMDAAIVDIESRALLFTASGQSTVESKATPVDVSRELRRGSQRGFEEATRDLIAQLATALDAFEEQAATGTIRGQGTPAVTMLDAEGNPVAHGQGGAGSVGLPGLAAVLALLALATRGRRTP